MSQNKLLLKLKRLLGLLNTKQGRGMIIIGLVVMTMAVGFLYAAGTIGNHGITADKFINLQQGPSPFKGFRRAHAKGICVEGEFIANGALEKYSTASFLTAGKKQFIGRYSTAGNNPTAPDLNAPVRSMALSFTSESGESWRVAMNTPPVMPVKTPEDFYQQLVVLGQGDPNKIKAFFAAHPESAAFNQWRASYQPTSSFASETYHSINAFYLVNAAGEKQAVRWMMRPQSPVRSTTQLDLDDADALQHELASRLESEPIKYDWVFILADDGDDETDPTTRWPDSRQTISAGTIEVQTWEAQLSGACNAINYDPLVLPTGIEPTADPISRARSAAYAESFKRRAWETLTGSDQSGAGQ